MLAAAPTIAFAEVLSPEPPDGIDDGRDTDVEVLTVVMLELGVL